MSSCSFHLPLYSGVFVLQSIGLHQSEFELPVVPTDQIEVTTRYDLPPLLLMLPLRACIRLFSRIVTCSEKSIDARYALCIRHV